MNEFDIQSLPGFAQPLSSWSHLIASGGFALLAIPLMHRAVRGSSQPGSAGPCARVVGVGVFCASVVTLLAISGVYHSLDFNSPGRSVLLLIDYAAIYILIAGTFTPICSILLRGLWRTGTLCLVWAIAITGITLKLVLFTQMTSWVGTMIYLGLGCCGFFGAALAWRRFGAAFVEPLLLGGAAYIAGTAVQLAQRPTIISGILGPHEIFHLAVLLGISFHWKFIAQFADGHLPLKANQQLADRLVEKDPVATS